MFSINKFPFTSMTEINLDWIIHNLAVDFSDKITINNAFNPSQFWAYRINNFIHIHALLIPQRAVSADSVICSFSDVKANGTQYACGYRYAMGNDTGGYAPSVYCNDQSNMLLSTRTLETSQALMLDIALNMTEV